MQSQFDEAREAFQRDLVDKMGEFGLSLDDFKPAKVKKERKKRSLPIKCRDPENPEHTWTGMGRSKKWLQEKLDPGPQSGRVRGGSTTGR
jgi:DNA-binding protein H-NS